MKFAMDLDAPSGCRGSLVSFALAVPRAIWSGFVLSKLWLWFVAEPFHVKPIGIALAIGLYLTTHSMIVIYTDGIFDRDTWRQVTRRVGTGFLFPAFTLLAAWIVTWFMP